MHTYTLPILNQDIHSGTTGKILYVQNLFQSPPLVTKSYYR